MYYYCCVCLNFFVFLFYFPLDVKFTLAICKWVAEFVLIILNCFCYITLWKHLLTSGHFTLCANMVSSLPGMAFLMVHDISLELCSLSAAMMQLASILPASSPKMGRVATLKASDMVPFPRNILVPFNSLDRLHRRAKLTHSLPWALHRSMKGQGGPIIVKLCLNICVLFVCVFAKFWFLVLFISCRWAVSVYLPSIFLYRANHCGSRMPLIKFLAF